MKSFENSIHKAKQKFVCFGIFIWFWSFWAFFLRLLNIKMWVFFIFCSELHRSTKFALKLDHNKKTVTWLWNETYLDLCLSHEVVVVIMVQVCSRSQVIVHHRSLLQHTKVTNLAAAKRNKFNKKKLLDWFKSHGMNEKKTVANEKIQLLPSECMYFY